MAKFIEVTRPMRDSNGDSLGLPVLLNLDLIDSVSDTGRFAKILFHNGKEIVAMETYEDIRLMIGACQGGIPMSKHTDSIRGMD